MELTKVKEKQNNLLTYCIDSCDRFEQCKKAEAQVPYSDWESCEWCSAIMVCKNIKWDRPETVGSGFCPLAALARCPDGDWEKVRYPPRKIWDDTKQRYKEMGIR